MSTESDITADSSSAAVRAVLRTDDSSPQTVQALTTRVGGLPLFARHLLAFRQAGIRQVTVIVPSAILPEVRRLAHEYSPGDVHVDVRSHASDVATVKRPAEIEQSLLTVVDPRLVAQLVRLAKSEPGIIVCVDAPDGEAVHAKSPYRVGVADTDEAKPLAPSVVGVVPIGLVLRAAPGLGQEVPRTILAVGRYYWHRVHGREDARSATWTILLATMKATDGIYAQTNRRVSLRISRALIGTPVTPNMVTVATLGLGLLAGWLLAQGRYGPVVAGSVLGWVASMLDGVDGELARARFQASDFGHWLEMVCDYAFYIVLVLGLGEGLRRLTGDWMWLAMGCVTAAGVVLGFAAVARLKRTYSAQGGASEFYSSYEQTARAPSANPFARITSHLTVFATRAAFPYYFVLFAILGMMKFVLVIFFVATQAFWVGALIVSRTVFANGRAAVHPASAGSRQ